MEPRAAILHVEDDPVDVINVRRAFSRCGFVNPILAAPNGDEALRMLRETADTDQPALILLDLSMPIMDGVEFLQVVKSDPELRQIPVVVLTAANLLRERREVYELGVAGYVLKPMQDDAFVEAVGTVARYWSLCELP